MRRTVTLTYLEMTEATHLRPADPVDATELSIVEAQVPSAELSRFLYVGVGRDRFWTERLDWSLERWQRWLDSARVRTWLASHQGTPAGYFQLAFDLAGDVEIVYLGFLPEFFDRGWGDWLLTVAIRQGWWHGATRVWLRTCSLDHQAALPEFEARGLRVFDERTETRGLPARPAPDND